MFHFKDSSLIYLLSSVDARTMWVGLTRNSNNKWYWGISGRQALNKNYWVQPERLAIGRNCATIGESWLSSGIIRSLIPTYCHYKAKVTFCQVPYIY